MCENRAVCLYCEGEMPPYGGVGRPRVFCCQGCADEAEGERERLRRRIEALEQEVLEQAGGFAFGARSAKPMLAAARQRLRDLAQA